MSSRTKDMTQGNPTKLILQFSLPLFMGEWGIYLSGIISWFGAAVLLALSCRRRLRRVSGQME